HLTVITLQVAMRFVGNYALRGLSPQTDGMPVIPKKYQRYSSSTFGIFEIIYTYYKTIKLVSLNIYIFYSLSFKFFYNNSWYSNLST
ncbi:MAG: hypothetical protein E6Z72_05855, partial [Peptostreptococcus sp.]|nr:hypothetical protein [Peptostreptococcus sp.]